ncbi:MAG: 23S rRNA (adenine(2030)-N(6))-methyltransferase RlmJ [Pseudomonadota bacterium]
MNYQHAFHAGNFADVMKHTALALVISRLRLKEKPFRVVDTHAGAGLYDLRSDEAQRGAEWQRGIARLIGAVEGGTLPKGILESLAPYLDAVRAVQPDGERCAIYPGSASIAASLLRPQDRLHANERQAAIAEKLRAALRHAKGARVTQGDGWALPASVLPPPERRAVVLIDPPFEDAGELERLSNALKDGHRRFQSGIFLLWYPIKDRRAIVRFHRAVANSGAQEVLACEILIQSDRHASRLNGCGLIVANPPYGFAQTYAAILAECTKLLAVGPDADYTVADLMMKANAEDGGQSERHASPKHRLSRGPRDKSSGRKAR